MISTRHLHPHAANTTTAQLRPDCCTAVARPLHDFCPAIVSLLHDFRPAIAPLLQGSGRPSAHAFRPCPRHRNHAQNTQIPNPHASRTTKGRLNRAIARWAGPGRVAPKRTNSEPTNPNHTCPNRTEPNKPCPGQSGPNTIRPGTIKPDTPLPGRVHARTAQTTAARSNSTTRCKLFFTPALYGGCASTPFDRCPMQTSWPENKSSYK